MTPSPNSLLRTASSDDLLCRLLSSDLNIQADSSVEHHSWSPRSAANKLPTLRYSSPDARLQNEDRDHTLDQLLDSELNRPPSRSLGEDQDHTLDQLLDSELNRPPSRSPGEDRDQTIDQLLDSELNRPPSRSPSDDVESEEEESNELVDEEDTYLSFPSSPTGEEFSQQEFLQLESRLYEMVGQWRNRELDDAENSMKVLKEKKRCLTARYAEVMRDKLTLWDIREQLEVAEASLMGRV